MSLVESNSPTGDLTIACGKVQGAYENSHLGETFVVFDGDDFVVEPRESTGPLEYVRGRGYFANFGLWGAPPELFVFPVTPGGGLLADWGDRLFQKH
ncbi:MAG: hypothetical protein AAGC71_02260 [Pseudomonadota bacterium]